MRQPMLRNLDSSVSITSRILEEGEKAQTSPGRAKLKGKTKPTKNVFARLAWDADQDAETRENKEKIAIRRRMRALNPDMFAPKVSRRSAGPLRMSLETKLDELRNDPEQLELLEKRVGMLLPGHPKPDVKFGV
ncbi:hypothetical protein CYMTET_53521 [Cymbomonas tetramitiformis]|uniref:Uncharacterized protein n=1 Tax=Cymbomonas tetramitiformis TaxID=36881 RepID=A0AAE0EPM6_9CHLO|nr:hypothetical protein CYMTET_53521 [Cymbomonas tetramitiformis]